MINEIKKGQQFADFLEASLSNPDVSVTIKIILEQIQNSGLLSEFATRVNEQYYYGVYDSRRTENYKWPGRVNPSLEGRSREFLIRDFSDLNIPKRKELKSTYGRPVYERWSSFAGNHLMIWPCLGVSMLIIWRIL